MFLHVFLNKHANRQHLQFNTYFQAIVLQLNKKYKILLLIVELRLYAYMYRFQILQKSLHPIRNTGFNPAFIIKPIQGCHQRC